VGSPLLWRWLQSAWGSATKQEVPGTGSTVALSSLPPTDHNEQVTITAADAIAAAVSVRASVHACMPPASCSPLRRLAAQYSVPLSVHAPSRRRSIALQRNSATREKIGPN
jgi:hypothetical protein